MLYGSTVAAWLACTFIGPPPNQHHSADHIDRNKLNDTLSNIRWASSSEQSKNQTRISVGAQRIAIIARKGDIVREFSSTYEAADALGCFRANIRKALLIPNRRSQGWSFQYKYIDERDGELWKALDSKRDISSFGRVRMKVNGGYVESQPCTKLPYISVGDSNGKSTGLHLLVSRYFGELQQRKEQDPTCEVDHIDGNTRNNAISNLQVLSGTEHRRKTGTKRTQLRHRVSGEVMVFESLKESAVFLKLKQNSVSRFATGKAQHPMYEIEYVNKRQRS
jgi:hypothetical protein